MTDLSHYLGGARVEGRSGRFADVFNPATGAVEKRVPLASSEEVAAVVATAKAAAPAWAKSPPLRRARILDRFKFLLQENADKLAELISAEHGKTHDDALGDPRPRGGRIRHRRPAPAQGRDHRERRHEHPGPGGWSPPRTPRPDRARPRRA